MYSSYQGTGLIGYPVIQEAEFSQGATITLTMVTDTVNKIFVSNFQHENYNNLVLSQDQIAQGSFSAVALGPSSLKLASQSTGLIAGRYLYDVSATSPDGTVSVSSLKEFKLLSSITASLSGQVQPVQGVQQLIDISLAAHNASLSAHPSLSGGSGGGAQFDLEFSQASLTSGDMLPVLHTLPSAPSAVTVYDELGNRVSLGWKILSSSTFEIDFADFVPIAGLWQLSATN